MKALRKKTLPAAISLALSAVILTPGVASAGWYAGIGAGQASYDDSISSSDLSSLESDLGDVGVFVDSVNFSTDDTDTAFKVFGGFQFNDYFALEAQYVDFGSLKADFNGTINDGAEGSGSFNGNASADSYGFGVNAVGMVPFLEHFAVLAKVGITRWDVNGDVSYGDSFGNALSESNISVDKGIDVNVGAGLKWTITQHIGVQAEWERYKIADEDVDLITGSFVWGF